MAKKKRHKVGVAPDGTKLLVRNRRATHDYQIHETIEAGMVLVGSEVKSLRDSHASIGNAYVEFRAGEAWLVGATIKEYPWANQFNHDPERDRKLLLKKREIRRFITRVEQRGFTLIPLSIYLKDGRIKVELGLASGKQLYEKRDASREADAQREIDRAMKSHRTNGP
ncbi:MAG: SsrA-binding protein SmpB [Proteobacteria bacterium]|nr:SsrA-binding protein SmpB [Pseudomonadota bacterium]